MCGSAIKCETKCRRRWCRRTHCMQDDFYKLEKDAMDAGDATDKQKEQQEICIIRL